MDDGYMWNFAYVWFIILCNRYSNLNNINIFFLFLVLDKTTKVILKKYQILFTDGNLTTEDGIFF